MLAISFGADWLTLLMIFVAILLPIAVVLRVVKADQRRQERERREREEVLEVLPVDNARKGAKP